MSSPHVRRLAVVCDDHATAHGPVVRLLTACGFEVAAVVPSFADVPELVRAHDACVAVVALPLTGMSGLLAVRALTSGSPDCQVVLLCPSGLLELTAVEAGARALVPDDDLRGLRVVLLEIAGVPLQARVPGARDHEEAAPSGSVRTKPPA